LRINKVDFSEKNAIINLLLQFSDIKISVVNEDIVLSQEEISRINTYHSELLKIDGDKISMYKKAILKIISDRKIDYNKDCLDKVVDKLINDVYSTMGLSNTNFDWGKLNTMYLPKQAHKFKISTKQRIRDLYEQFICNGTGKFVHIHVLFIDIIKGAIKLEYNSVEVDKMTKIIIADLELKYRNNS
jgi:hypothetical protein